MTDAERLDAIERRLAEIATAVAALLADVRQYQCEDAMLDAVERGVKRGLDEALNSILESVQE